MPASTNPPYPAPRPLGYTVNGVPPTADDPAATPVAIDTVVNGTPVDATDPTARPGTMEYSTGGAYYVDPNQGKVPQKPLVTTVDGVLVDWLSPEPAPGGLTV